MLESAQVGKTRYIKPVVNGNLQPHRHAPVGKIGTIHLWLSPVTDPEAASPCNRTMADVFTIIERWCPDI